MPQAEAYGREQQRKWNGYRHNQRRARVSQEQEQNDDDQDDALGQIVQHGVRGEFHQFAAIDERNDLYPGRQNDVVQFVNLGVYSLEHVVGIGALTQQNDPGNHVFVIDNLSVLATDGAPELAQ